MYKIPRIGRSQFTGPLFLGVFLFLVLSSIFGWTCTSLFERSNRYFRCSFSGLDGAATDHHKSFFNPIYSSNGAGIVDIEGMNAFTNKTNSFMSEGRLFFLI